LDHFFFCFFAPAAAGAILNYLFGGWMKVGVKLRPRTRGGFSGGDGHRASDDFQSPMIELSFGLG
jgi:hypothetical protein